jgi:error-prone DNA polymerase
VQRGGEVVPLVANKLTDPSAELAAVGERNAGFPMPHGRDDQIKDGGSFAQTNEIFHQEASIARHLYPDLHIDSIKAKPRLP